MTLTEFLLARIAEDEVIARAATPGTLPPGLSTWEASDREGVTEIQVDPARILAECEAKRQRVAILDDMERHPDNATSSRAYELLCLEATPYALHPDCREEWRARETCLDCGKSRDEIGPAWHVQRVQCGKEWKP
jgi:hypothetical protein